MPKRAVAMPIEVGSVNECGLAYPSPVRRGNAFGRAAYPSPAKRGRVGERSEPGWGTKFAPHPTRLATLGGPPSPSGRDNKRPPQRNIRLSIAFHLGVAPCGCFNRVADW